MGVWGVCVCRLEWGCEGRDRGVGVLVCVERWGFGVFLEGQLCVLCGEFGVCRF